MNAGELAARIGLNIQPFVAAMGQLSTQVSRLGATLSSSLGSGAQNSLNGTRNSVNNLTSSFKDLDRMVSGILISQIFYAGVNAIEDGISSVVHFSSEMEKAGIAMEYFVGNAERAAGFITNMQDFAADTAFSTEQALQLSRRLMGAQVKPEQIRGVMTILNDANAATGATAQQMDRIVLALTQMKTNGKIAGQELRQLAEAGIPIYSIIRKELGLTQKQMQNIGKLGISGDKGVAAVLKGLQDQYQGAADRIADTLGGMWDTIKDDTLFISEKLFKPPMDALRRFLKVWRDGIDKAREAMTLKGIGGAFESLIPDKEVQEKIRNIIAGFRDLAKAGAMIWSALGPTFKLIGSSILSAMNLVIPVLAKTATVFAQLAKGAMQAWPWLKYLAAAVIGLVVAQVAAKALMFLWSVTRLGVICTAVAGAVTTLSKAIRGLTLVLTKNPIVAGIMLVVGALLYLIMTSKSASAWLDNLMKKLGALGGLAVDSSDIFDVEDLGDSQKWIDEFNEQVEGLNDNLKDTGKEIEGTGKDADKAGKKVEDKFVAAFDELYQIPDKLDDIGKGLGDVGDVDTPALDLDLGLGKLPTLPKVEQVKVEPADFSHFWDNWKFPPIFANMKKWFTDFEWPKFPPPNFGVATAVLETVNSLINKFKFNLGDLGLSWEGLGDFAKNLGNVLNPIPGIFTNIVDILSKVHGAFDRLVDTLPPVTEWAQGLKNIIDPTLDSLLAAVREWIGDVQSAFQGWSVDVVGAMTTWRLNAEAAITTWATNALASIKTWISDVKTGFATWGTDVVSSLTTWRLNAQTAISTWATNAKSTVNTWISDIKTGFATWATDVVTSLTSWRLNAETVFSTWVTNVKAKFSTWSTDVKTTVSTWSANTKKLFGDWKVGVEALVTEWSTAVQTTFKNWGNNVQTTLSTWGNNIGKLFNDVFSQSNKMWGDFVTGTAANWAEFLNKTSSWTETWGKDMGRVFGQVATAASAAMNALGSNGWGALDAFFAGAADGVTQWARGFVNTVMSGAKAAWGWLKNLASAAGQTLGGFADNVDSSIKAASVSMGAWYDKNKNWAVPAAITVGVVGGALALAPFTGGWSLAGLAALETGGIVDQDQIVRIGEGNKREAVIPLENSSYMKPFSKAVANDLASMLGEQVSYSGGGGGGGDMRPVMYVHTLVADERALKELERKLDVIRVRENERKGR